GNDADTCGLLLMRNAREFVNGFNRPFDRSGLQLLAFVKSFAQPSLPAVFEQRLHFATSNIGDQQLDGIGSDINYCPSLERHARLEQPHSSHPSENRVTGFSQVINRGKKCSFSAPIGGFLRFWQKFSTK